MDHSGGAREERPGAVRSALRPALEIINSLPRFAGANYLFTTTGNTAVSGFSRAKERLDRVMLAVAKIEAEERGEDPAEVTIPH